MEEYKLIGTMCEETGVLGLVLDTMNTSNFSDGDLFVMADAIGIAHDLTEHPNGVSEIGTVFDEFQALGAIWFTRGELGDMTRDGSGSAHSPEQHLASDVSRMARIAYNDGLHGRLDEQPEHDHDEYFDTICHEAKKDMAENEFDGEIPEDFDLDDYLQQALWGLRLGYDKQGERFDSSYAANNRFWNIHEAVEHVFKCLDYEGQEFMLYIDADNQARANEYYEDEEEQLE
jgi:hypothetical protein